MINSEIQDQLNRELERLSPESQREVLEFARSLRTGRLPAGMSGRELVERFAGTITPEDAELMKRAIEEEFEKVDEDE